ncbi:hypothetical protein PV10_06624 [Exophiala mesophila]|uniref:RING-type domain-containing protein n=1 Tax=Exophiala mesophila TaxID=212818 RepID=A0A0D1ZZ91_EXOME|nr:uncharacterized protein PV10_06624 [Exophiala mesophila]KIV92163.1 hypothetical protein PV10_06624 [Exophiala mesophila]
MNKGQDTVIDDDEETCPLCIEEFDLSDKNFRPCPCGYQICQFCFNSLKNTYEKSTCPNCRRPYDEKTIQYKIPTAEEFKLDQMNKNKKQAAAKRKETEKREVESSSRRNLAGVRVKQQNLVYVIGLIPSIKDEQALLQTLRGPEYFGQYGEIDKIVVSKTKPGAANQGIGVYVTYARKEDAALCINSVDGSLNGDRVLRAQFGTTKYCSAYLRGEVCNNKSCSFLHETGEDGQHTSLQNEPHGARLSTKPTVSAMTNPISVPPRPLSSTTNTHPLSSSASKDDELRRKESHDGSALPSTASWANANAPIARTRRASQANSRATPSPALTHASLSVPKPMEPKSEEVATSQTPAAQPSRDNAPPSQGPPPKAVTKPVDPIQAQYDFVLQALSRNIPFIYDDSCLTSEQRAEVDLMPQFIDPYGGAKRRAMREREEAERAKLESEAKSKLEAQAIASAEETLEEDDMAAGSLALGGEPEDDPRSLSSRSAIGRPSQTISDQFSSLSMGNRSLTPQQRQTLSQHSSTRNTAFEMSDFDRREPQYSQAQFEQISSHQRHGSRYFNNDTKSNPTTRFPTQQAGYYTSGVQGPPPGLPTAGTPPVSGGGMFAHGQNFTNPGFGTSKDTGADAYSRTRSGTNQGHDASKLDEKNFPPLPFRSDTQNSALHSRVSSFHSLNSSGLRSSTPKIPPGFELSHAHPAAPGSRVASPAKSLGAGPRSISSASGTVAPAVPFLPSAQRIPTPKPKSTETPKESLSSVPHDEKVGPDENISKNNNLDVSFGSPKPRALGKSKSKEVELSQGPSKSAPMSRKETISKAGPGQIEIPGPVGSVNEAMGESGTPVDDSGVVGTPKTQNSLPATPAATTPSETSKASIARPRLLRLTTGTSAKNGSEAGPSSAVTERSGILPSILGAKKGSRRPSVVSSAAQESRPSTPGFSERPSHDVSRASSPPPSIVGSAPDRGKSKSQLKKERREKAKKQSEPTEAVAAPPVPPPVEAVAPVIARQKKQKKRPESGPGPTAGESSASASKTPAEEKHSIPTPAPAPSQSRQAEKESASKKQQGVKSQEKNKASPVKAAKPATTQDAPTPPASATPEVEPVSVKDEEISGLPYTLRDLYMEADRLAGSDGAASSAVIQKLLNGHVSPMSKILNAMIQSGDLPKDHPWLNPTSFNSPGYKLQPDTRRGQDYLEGNGYSANDAFGYVYLPMKEKQALKDGHAVSVADVGDKKEDLLKKCLVTSSGWVLRHLSGSESEKLLELDERRHMYLEEFGEVGLMEGLGALEADDYSNLAGGMDHLSRYGERHGVVWVVGEGEHEDDMPEEDDDEFEIYDDEEGDMEVDSGHPEGGEFESAADGQAASFDNANVNMPGAWDIPPPAPASEHRLPGLVPHSKSSAFTRGRSSASGPGGAAQGDNQDQPSTSGQGQSSALIGSRPARSGMGNHGRSHNHPINLRALDSEVLTKRVAEKQKELEAARKEMEKVEKLWNKKSKDIGRWREGLAKA